MKYICSIKGSNVSIYGPLVCGGGKVAIESDGDGFLNGDLDESEIPIRRTSSTSSPSSSDITRQFGTEDLEVIGRNYPAARIIINLPDKSTSHQVTEQLKRPRSTPQRRTMSKSPQRIPVKPLSQVVSPQSTIPIKQSAKRPSKITVRPLSPLAFRKASPTPRAMTPTSQRRRGSWMSIDEEILHELLVEGWLGEDPVFITIDTASPHSLISRAFLERCGLRRYANRREITACLLTLGGSTIEVDFLVVDDLPRDITLGLDTLKAYQFCIDFDRDEALFGRYGRVQFAVGGPVQFREWRSRTPRRPSPTRQSTKIYREPSRRSSKHNRDSKKQYTLRPVSLHTPRSKVRKSSKRDRGSRDDDASSMAISGYIEGQTSYKAMNNRRSRTDADAIRRLIREEFPDTYAVPLVKWDRFVSRK